MLREAKGAVVRLKILTSTGHVELPVTAGDDLPQPETATPAASEERKPRRKKDKAQKE